MADEKLSLLVGVDTIKKDLGVSRATAYRLIQKLNKEMKEQNPKAIVIAGKVNRFWYDKACLRQSQDRKETSI